MDKNKIMALTMLYSSIGNIGKFDYSDNNVKGKSFKEGIKNLKTKKQKKRKK